MVVLEAWVARPRGRAGTLVRAPSPGRAKCERHYTAGREGVHPLIRPESKFTAEPAAGPETNGHFRKRGPSCPNMGYGENRRQSWTNAWTNYREDRFVAEPTGELSVKDAAELLRVSEKTIYRWIRQGVIPAFRFQGQYRFDRSELQAWARYKRIGSTAKPPAPSEGEEDVNLPSAIRRGGIHYKIEGDSSEALYRALVQIFPVDPPRDPQFRETLVQTLIEREALAPTGIGHGLAIPHPRHPRDWGLGEPVVGVFFLEQPVDYHAFDNQPVRILFVILCATVKGHLRMLAQVSHLLHDPVTREFLNTVPTRTELMARIASLIPDQDHAAPDET